MAGTLEQRKRQTRRFRDRRDVLNELSDPELIERYRLDRAGILYVTDLVRDALTSPTRRNKALTPEMKVIITLRYLATGEMQQCSSDDLGPSQPTISKVIRETVYALATRDVLKKCIKFPLTQDETRVKEAEFRNIDGLPGVIGVVTGTHIRIVPPTEYEAEYVNSKGQHSINVQVVLDTHGKFLDISSRWPGSVHDARVLRESELNQGFERGMVPAGYHLVGDSGYPSTRWLLTPYVQPLPGKQTIYNRTHQRTRSIVERGIHQWKQRFHVLRSEIRVTPPAYVAKITQVCAMLHNICKGRNIPEPDGEGDIGEGVDGDNPDPPTPQPPVGAHPPEGLLYRDEYVNLYFQDGAQPHLHIGA